ncbi:MAG: hypothetical protein JSV86_09325 [Gemmatimonadota bacterium]|nr:MAG: hypothetical protein JSV86_09325 [Gemmatimonadota bacterium]
MMGRVRSSESGIALIAVLLGMALLTVIGAALTAIGIVEFRTAINHRSATRALLLADAGANHALALMRGPLSTLTYTDVIRGADGSVATLDDGVLSGFGLDAFDEVPDTGVVLGKGRYFVRLENDPADPSGDPYTDSNHRLVATCRGETRDGGAAEVGIVLAAPSFPAIVSNGDLTLPGNPEVLGPCAGVHANGTLSVSGHPTVDGPATYSDAVVLNGTIYNTNGSIVVPAYAGQVEVPYHDPDEYRDQADYELRDGWVINVGQPRDSTFATGSGVHGWNWNAGQGTWSLAGNKAAGGTYFVNGNVEVTGNAGSDGDPLKLTIIATGSVKVAGNPKIEADHPDGILILAGGDVDIAGNASGITLSYAGLVYAGGQCQVNGTPSVGGHILCYDGPDPLGAADLVSDNKVNGTPTVTYDCTGERRRTMVASWWENRAR